MAHPLSLTHYQQLLGSSEQASLEQFFSEVEILAQHPHENLSPSTRKALQGLRQFFAQSDAAFVKMGQDFAQLTLKSAGIEETPRDLPDRPCIQADQLALIEAHARQAMLLDYAADAVFVTDDHQKWTYANDLALSMLGYTREQVIGVSIYQFIQEKYRSQAQAVFLPRLRQEKFLRDEIRLLHRSGRSIPVEMHAAILPDGSIYVSCRDITERKLVEKALIQAKETAESANQAKNEFLATISHEIRTPMNGIIGMTELALDSELNTQQRGYLELLKCSASALLGMINDILDFSKLESAKLILENNYFNLPEMLDGLLAMVTVSAEQKGLQLRLELDPAIAQVLQGDIRRLRQVLTHLLSNAIKFSYQGKVVLKLTAVGHTDTHCSILFAVSDQGLGISEQKKELIFQPFRQADASSTRHYAGIGLGLSICSGLVKIMGGDLQLHSEYGSGSEFYFTLRFGYTRSESVSDTQTGTAQGDTEIAWLEPTHSASLHVLVVEDNFVNQKLTLALLGKWGHTSVVAENGLVALEKYKQQSFDVILMDMQMPLMGGVEATRQIRAIEAESTAEHMHIPIIAMTANAMAGDMAECIACGMDHYLAKPIQTERMRELLSLYAGASIKFPKARSEYPAAKVRRTSDQQSAQFDYLQALESADREILHIMIPLFLADYQTIFQDVADSIRQQDILALRRNAHTLKGLLGHFMATPIENNAKALEQQAKLGSLDRVGYIFEEMQEQIIVMNQALRDYMQNKPE